MKTPIFLSIVLVALCAVQPAYAYIDPGTGSALLQGCIAGIAALVVFWRRLLDAVTGFFARRRGENGKP